MAGGLALGFAAGLDEMSHPDLGQGPQPRGGAEVCVYEDSKETVDVRACARAELVGLLNTSLGGEFDLRVPVLTEGLSAGLGLSLDAPVSGAWTRSDLLDPQVHLGLVVHPRDSVLEMGADLHGGLYGDQWRSPEGSVVTDQEWTVGADLQLGVNFPLWGKQ